MSQRRKRDGKRNCTEREKAARALSFRFHPAYLLIRLPGYAILASKAVSSRVPTIYRLTGLRSMPPRRDATCPLLRHTSRGPLRFNASNEISFNRRRTRIARLVNRNKL